jgi:hypothetical protein
LSVSVDKERRDEVLRQGGGIDGVKGEKMLEMGEVALENGCPFTSQR